MKEAVRKPSEELRNAQPYVQVPKKASSLDSKKPPQKKLYEKQRDFNTKTIKQEDTR